MARTEHSRRHARYDVQGVHGNFLFSIDVDVRNLSIAGMAVETARALNVGRRYTFNIAAGEDQIRVPGRVMWCVLGQGRREAGGEVCPVFQAGIHFEDVVTDLAGELLHLIEESAVLDVEQRVFGRFHPGTAEVRLDSGLAINVRRISLNGALIDLRGVDHDFARVDALVPLELDLSGARFSATGRVAWVNGASGQGTLAGRTELGLEFVHLEPAQRDLLERFIVSVVQDTPLEV